MALLQVKVPPLPQRLSPSRKLRADASAIMSTAVEATGFIVLVISLVVTGASLANDQWKISTVMDDLITSVRQTVNLWHSCTENSIGLDSCKDFDSLLALPIYVQVCRALMIIALLLQLVAIVTSLLGLNCIKIGSTDEQTKAKIATAAGVIGILGGLSCLVAVSWYANQVVQEFYSPLSAGIRFELGTGLYLGWGGATLSVLGGALLCCACRRASGGPKGGYYGNAPAKVYSGAPKSDPDSRAYV